MKHSVKAFAKINLSLDVVSKREDGYHNLKTVMHSIPLCDVIDFEENSEGVFRLHSESTAIPLNDSNIIIKACRAFFSETGIKLQGFDITVNKNIPVAAGLAGGSTDAAATLKFLNEYHGFPLNEEELSVLGKSIGADVPFCLKGGTCLCEGIGEIITPLPPLPECFIVVAKPQTKGLSTKKIFSVFEVTKQKFHPDTKGMLEAISEGRLHGICQRMFNVLEEYSVRECPEIGELLKLLSDNGALSSIMSGSGSAVFGIFESAEAAQKASEALKESTNTVFVLKNE